MVSSGSWRDHFKIDENILKAFWEEFSESSPLRASELTLESAQSTTEFVLWCVRERHFTEQAFIDHQSEQLNLPAVRPEFFATPVDLLFWDRVKDIHPWDASCFPLSEWDGHLLIAAVWPNESLRVSVPHSFVLGTPTGLREFYSRFSPIPKEGEPVTTPVVQRTVAPPEFKSEIPVLVPPPAPQEAPVFDSGDPFAALSRELGLVAESSNEHSPAEEVTAEAPEGFVIPEGLSVSSAEVSRLGLDQPEGANDSAAVADSAVETFEGATLIHNFEDGSDELVQRKPVPTSESAHGMFAPPETVAPPPPPAPVVELELTQEPAMPFIPIVTAESPAMVKPAPPPPPPAPEAQSTAFDPESPTRPIAEATIVVAAESMETVTEPKTRKPLFEPSGGGSPLPSTSISDRMKQMSAQRADGTQSGDQTGTKSRKLEAPPVTSFFGINTSKTPITGKMHPATSTKCIAVSRLNPIHLDQCTTIDEAGAQALLQMSNIFETAMILLFKDGVLQPWKWSDLFLSVNGDKPQPIQLLEPSIFKIVFRTAKPYHGYVVTSAMNQKFFNEFNRGMLPKHATVLPVMIDGRMGGMLLAFTNSKIDYRASLRLMERLSFDLSRVFKLLRGTMSKAS